MLLLIHEHVNHFGDAIVILKVNVGVLVLGPVGDKADQRPCIVIVTHNWSCSHQHDVVSIETHRLELHVCVGVTFANGVTLIHDDHVVVLGLGHRCFDFSCALHHSHVKEPKDMLVCAHRKAFVKLGRIVALP